MNWISNAINLGLIALLVWAFSFEILGVIIAFLVSGTLVAAYGLVILIKAYRIRIRFHRKIIMSLLKMGILFSVSFFILQLNYRIDILLIEKLRDATEVGLYSIGASIAEQLWQLPLAIGIVVFSRINRLFDRLFIHPQGSAKRDTISEEKRFHTVKAIDRPIEKIIFTCYGSM